MKVLQIENYTAEQFDKKLDDLLQAAFNKGVESANDHYVSVNEAAGIMGTSTKKVYKMIERNKFVNILENPLRILKSEILFQK